MAGLASAAAVVVALVLVAAAAAKVAHHRRTVAGFEQLGLPAPAVLARAVPVVEAAVAALLVVDPGWGGVAAFALLAGFTSYLGAIVASGRQVSCGCFGSSGSHPVSRRDLARNAALLAAAALATTHRGALVLELPALALVGIVTLATVLVLRAAPATRPSASSH